MKAEQQEKDKKEEEGDKPSYTPPTKDYFQEKLNCPPDPWDLIKQLHHIKIDLVKAQVEKNAFEKRIKSMKSRGEDIIIFLVLGMLFLVYAADKRVKDADGQVIATLGPIEFLRCQLSVQVKEKLEECARAKAQAEEKKAQEKKDEMHRLKMEWQLMWSHRCDCGRKIGEPGSAMPLGQDFPPDAPIKRRNVPTEKPVDKVDEGSEEPRRSHKAIYSIW